MTTIMFLTPKPFSQLLVFLLRIKYIDIPLNPTAPKVDVIVIKTRQFFYDGY